MTIRLVDSPGICICEKHAPLERSQISTALDETNCEDILPEPRQQYRWCALRQRLGTVRGWPPGAAPSLFPEGLKDWFLTQKQGKNNQLNDLLSCVMQRSAIAMLVFYKEDVQLLFSRLSRGLAQSCTHSLQALIRPRSLAFATQVVLLFASPNVFWPVQKI